MELNVFTEQLEKCYNLLAQQFVLIKQLKDLTISDKTNTEDINTIKTSILNLQNQLNTMVNDYVSKEGLQTALDSIKSGTSLYIHTITTNMFITYPEDDVETDITIEVVSSRPTPYENLTQLDNDIVILRPTNLVRFIEGLDPESYSLIMFSLYSGGGEPYFIAYDDINEEMKSGFLQIDIFNDDVTPY